MKPPGNPWGTYHPLFVWFESLCSSCFISYFTFLECLASLLPGIFRYYWIGCRNSFLLWFIADKYHGKKVCKKIVEKNLAENHVSLIFPFCNTGVWALLICNNKIWSHVYTQIYTLSLARWLRSPTLPRFLLFKYSLELPGLLMTVNESVLPAYYCLLRGWELRNVKIRLPCPLRLRRPSLFVLDVSSYGFAPYLSGIGFCPFILASPNKIKVHACCVNMHESEFNPFLKLSNILF